ncbi:hypothetical protein K491DRAFT_696196 [Lophiostoma macrostomum CBS 122681]|uniref:MFS general substrate transporter n=1 Tax=Lophiostoma macrostomum CBS 122681 TaxID=1314788 RepID=A0A6A6SZQ1_9PLEO|nr:hypothetical protein K491DRAFT_696196 [Lophiostoma macrostomum CBS 122681]
MALVVFAQSLGSANSLTLRNVMFVPSLKTQLIVQAPNVDVNAVIRAGATGSRSIVHPNDLTGVLNAYSNSDDRTFVLVTALAAMCGIALWGLGWKDLRKKTGRENDESECTEDVKLSENSGGS